MPTILEQLAELRTAVAAQYARAETILEKIDALEADIRAEDAKPAPEPEPVLKVKLTAKEIAPRRVKIEWNHAEVGGRYKVMGADAESGPFTYTGIMDSNGHEFDGAWDYIRLDDNNGPVSNVAAVKKLAEPAPIPEPEPEPEPDTKPPAPQNVHVESYDSTKRQLLVRYEDPGDGTTWEVFADGRFITTDSDTKAYIPYDGGAIEIAVVPIRAGERGPATKIVYGATEPAPQPEPAPDPVTPKYQTPWPFTVDAPRTERTVNVAKGKTVSRLDDRTKYLFERGGSYVVPGGRELRDVHLGLYGEGKGAEFKFTTSTSSGNPEFLIAKERVQIDDGIRIEAVDKDTYGIVVQGPNVKIGAVSFDDRFKMCIKVEQGARFVQLIRPRVDLVHGYFILIGGQVWPEDILVDYGECLDCDWESGLRVNGARRLAVIGGRYLNPPGPTNMTIKKGGLQIRHGEDIYIAGVTVGGQLSCGRHDGDTGPDAHTRFLTNTTFEDIELLPDTHVEWNPGSAGTQWIENGVVTIKGK